MKLAILALVLSACIPASAVGGDFTDSDGGAVRCDQPWTTMCAKGAPMPCCQQGTRCTSNGCEGSGDPFGPPPGFPVDGRRLDAGARD